MSDLPPGFPIIKIKNQRQKTDDPVLRGKRNKQYGARRQADVRKFFEQLTNRTAAFHGRKANEETWSHLPVRLEVKAGMQCGPVTTAYLKQEAQAEAARSVGDVRPFVAAAAPEGISDFIISVRASRLVDVMQALGYFQTRGDQ